MAGERRGKEYRRQKTNYIGPVALHLPSHRTYNEHIDFFLAFAYASSSCILFAPPPIDCNVHIPAPSWH
jgi:hypothetical protein